MACGTPVVAFDTGAIPELVEDTCGQVVKYGANPWSLAYPDVKGLANAIVAVQNEYETRSFNAKKKAINDYDLDDVVSKYTKVIKKALV